jgi:hypothetical protein
LAVVPGAAAARSNGHAGRETGGEEGTKFVDRAGLGYEVGAFVIEERLQSRGIPVVILGERFEGVAGFNEIFGAEESAKFDAEGVGKGGHGERRESGAEGEQT